MNMRRIWISVGAPAGCLCLTMAAALIALAQGPKTGLWQTSTTMTWQQSPMPNGMMPGGAKPISSQSCVTQAMIDKFGGPMQNNRKECQVNNVKKGDHGMTAEMVCTGSLSGKGTVEIAFTDPEHSVAKTHFTGTMQAGPNPRPIEWTTESTSVYKGADCGSVKPMVMPDK